MKTRRYLSILFLFIVINGFFSCSDDNGEDDPVEPEIAERTIFMFLPYTSDLYNEEIENLDSIKSAIKKQNGLGNDKFLFFMSSSSSSAALIQVRYKNKKCVQDTLEKYTNPSLTSASFITSLINTVKTDAKAYNYAMIIGCHGIGWIPSTGNSKSVASLSASLFNKKGNIKTRWFGDPYNKIDVTTLAKGIEGSNTKMQYILFDACYMSNIETAYDLKDATDYLIASTSEVMSYGMPYDLMWKYLIATTLDYSAICDKFYDFYSTYKYPYGTLAVTDCSQLDGMATIMKEINAKYTFDTSLRSSLQILGGYTPTIFFDYGDYVKNLCGNDETLYPAFTTQLSLLVPYMRYTNKFFSSINGDNTYPINTFSGLTISEPSANTYYMTEDGIKGKGTAWYIATH